MENGGAGAEGGEYTRDGSVDLRGNPVLRSKRGGWRACTFIVVYELFERMAYYGIASNLVIYMTEKMHQGTVEAANNVTNWSGAVFITPLIGAVVADAYLGRYWTFVAGSAVYLMTSTSPKTLKFTQKLLHHLFKFKRKSLLMMILKVELLPRQGSGSMASSSFRRR